MFKRKLKALNYMDWDKVNGNDPEHLRKIIVWLEDQKIRHYKIEDRESLRDTQSENWQNTFEKYCRDVRCPIMDNSLDQLEWFIGLAVQFEYRDDLENHKTVLGKKMNDKEVVPTLKSTNPLDNLDFNSKEFIDGVNSIAKILNVPKHPDHLVTLEACSKVVCKRLNSNAVANPDTVIIKGNPFPLASIDSGLKAGDKVLDDAIKYLSLLYIQDLRDLQTNINETIVTVQTITANPKTDTRLGKVGI